MSARRPTFRAALVAAAVLLAGAARAATALREVRHSPDTTVELSLLPVHDEQLVAEDLAAATVALVGIGPFPAAADLDAYAVEPDGDALLSFDTTVALPGGVVAGPADLVRWDGTAYTTAFAAAAAGIPPGANLDAVAVRGGDLLLSFDVTVVLGSGTVGPEDLVAWNGGAAGLAFDGSAAGLPPGLDLDAADAIDCNGHLLLSFDGSGSVGGVPFDDEDVLEHDGSGWEMAYEGGARHAAWPAADLDALSAVPDLGPGPPVTFGQTITAAADKVTFRWAEPVDWQAAAGAFASSADVGSYAEHAVWSGTGTAFGDLSAPAPGHGLWYLVRLRGCFPSSWQSSPGAEPGRDPALP